MELLAALIAFGLTLLLMVSISSVAQSVLARRAKLSAWKANELSLTRQSGVLWALVGLASAYGVLVHFLRTLTGSPMLDGSIGVALGLYICAHPAANAVDILFFDRDLLQRFSERSVLGWLVLNLLVLLAGWMVIFTSLRRLLARSA
jgi:hypothetical protein